MPVADNPEEDFAKSQEHNLKSMQQCLIVAMTCETATDQRLSRNHNTVPISMINLLPEEQAPSHSTERFDILICPALVFVLPLGREVHQPTV